MPTTGAEVIEELRALAAAYATGVDRRDAALVRSCFAPDARLVIRGRDGVRPQPERRLDGVAAIGGITTTIARYRRTFHLLGQGRYEVAGDRATGEVYCEAHHHEVDARGAVVDRVLYIRYQDEYGRGEDGTWRITSRIVGVDWAVDLALGALGDADADDVADPRDAETAP